MSGIFCDVQHAPEPVLTDHWPTLMSREVGKEDGTCYALTFIRSPREQEVWLMFGLNGMWGIQAGTAAHAPLNREAGIFPAGTYG